MSSIWMLCPRALVGGNPAGDARRGLRQSEMVEKQRGEVDVLRLILLGQLTTEDGGRERHRADPSFARLDSRWRLSYVTTYRSVSSSRVWRRRDRKWQRIGAADLGGSLGAQGGDGECHGDAVVSVGIDFGAVQGLSSGNFQTVVALFDFGAHLAQVGGKRQCDRTL